MLGAIIFFFTVVVIIWYLLNWYTQPNNDDKMAYYKQYYSTYQKPQHKPNNIYHPPLNYSPPQRNDWSDYQTSIIDRTVDCATINNPSQENQHRYEPTTNQHLKVNDYFNSSTLKRDNSRQFNTSRPIQQPSYGYYSTPTTYNVYQRQTYQQPIYEQRQPYQNTIYSQNPYVQHTSGQQPLFINNNVPQNTYPQTQHSTQTMSFVNTSQQRQFQQQPIFKPEQPYKQTVPLTQPTERIIEVPNETKPQIHHSTTPPILDSPDLSYKNENSRKISMPTQTIPTLPRTRANLNSTGGESTRNSNGETDYEFDVPHGKSLKHHKVIKQSRLGNQRRTESELDFSDDMYVDIGSEII
ncbi:hypothetical protein QTN25_004237 [Entamoeba marina]